MKKIKRVLALTLSLLMLTAMCVSVSAASSPEVKGSIELMNPQNNVTYTAAKVFDVTYDDMKSVYAYTMTTDNPWVSSVVAYATPTGTTLATDWVSTTANGLTVTKIIKGGSVVGYSVKPDDADPTAFSAADFAAYLMGKIDGSAVTPTTVSPTQTTPTVKFTDLPLGYWLVIPSGSSATAPKLASLDTTDNAITVYDKNEVPAVEKVILDDKYHCGYPADVAEATHKHSAACYETKIGEASVGDKVTFQLTSKIPDTTGYDKYFFVIHDTLSDGLAYAGDLVVKVGTSTLTADSDYTLAYGKKTNGTDDTQHLRIVFKDVVGKVSGSVYSTGDPIVVTYKAKVDDDALVNSANTNTSYVQYSNDPGDDVTSHYPEKDPTDPNKPFTPPTTPPDDPDDPAYKDPDRPDDKLPTGNGPDSSTDTYTTKLNLQKYKDSVGTTNKLAGAKFKLTGTALNRVKVTGQNYVPYVTANPAPDKYYKLTNGNFTTTAPTSTTAADYESTTDEYMLVEEQYYDTKATTPQSAEAFVDSTGALVFSGLGEGVYTLSEIVTPDGYNPIDDMTITIVFDEGDPANDVAPKFYIQENVKPVTGGTDPDPDTMNMNFDVVNKSGVRLPQTGGMGTTVFYVSGSILLLGAAIMLITRKRMAAQV